MWLGQPELRLDDQMRFMVNTAKNSAWDYLILLQYAIRLPGWLRHLRDYSVPLLGFPIKQRQVVIKS